MHGLTKVAPIPGAGRRVAPPSEAAPEAEHVWLKCDACGKDMRAHDRLGHCIPAQPVIRVGAHHIGITK